MSAQRQLDIKNHVLMNRTALGNSNYGFREVCSDLLKSHGTSKKARQDIIDGTFLCAVTLDRLTNLNETENGAPYRPQVETIERVLRYFGAEVTFNQVIIKRAFANKPKAEV